ncbi:SAM-dependent methyltransferase [Bordetella genomosp. 8]|uniref:SAM-dependent methyltransferase n=1 Tax=Bordetella genomosp. 8 TaxID=1416806 RepID=A0A1W6YFL3_9BORD|nr:class I SAM-dependent methyltransferase [Bordetella genomosp. 8]ARP79809.1 SAM-dependent methyltransferase [Bordetella genomosp. 8]
MTFHTSRRAARSFTGVLRAAAAAALALPLWVAPVAAQERAATPAASGRDTYKPTVGQEGKDVVWVPTPQVLVEKMLDMAQVTPRDKLLDLGSGDGRTVITAAKRGLRARGIEYNPQMVELARRNAKEAGVADRASFVTADLFKTDLGGADVITMFLLPSINEQLRPRLLALKPGTRVVSNSFRMGDWQPDRSESVREGCDHYCTALLWIVPAKVDGTWRLGKQDLQLRQKYQVLSGTLGSTPITEARLDGDRISFKANGAAYSGTITGKAMQGTVSGGSGGNWSASRL